MINFVVKHEFMEKPICFITNCNGIEKLLSIIFKPYLIECNELCDSEDVMYLYKVDLNCYHIKYNDFDMLVNEREIHNNLRIFIDNRFKLKSNYYFLHCAALQKNGKTVLFIGGSGAGKSTITTFLSYQGYDYIADDKIIINSEDLSVHPFTRFIQLRPEACQLLENNYYISLNKMPVSIFGYERFEVEPKTIVNEDEIIKIDLVIQLCLDKNEKMCNMVKVDFSDAVQSILYNGYLSKSLHQSIKSGIEIARKVPFYKLSYYNLDLVAAEIDSL